MMVVHLHCGILLSNGKEQTSGAGPNTRTLTNSCLWAKEHTHAVVEQAEAICGIRGQESGHPCQRLVTRVGLKGSLWC